MPFAFFFLESEGFAGLKKVTLIIAYCLWSDMILYYKDTLQAVFTLLLEAPLSVSPSDLMEGIAQHAALFLMWEQHTRYQYSTDPL